MDRRVLAEQMIDRFKPVHLDIEVLIFIVLTNDGFDEFNFEQFYRGIPLYFIAP